MADALTTLADVVLAPDAPGALRAMHEQDVLAALCGPCPGGSCFGRLWRIADGWPEVQRLLIGDPQAQDIADAINQAHVHHFLAPPIAAPPLRLAVASACRAFGLVRDNARLALKAKMRGPAPRRDARRVAEALADPGEAQETLGPMANGLDALQEPA